MSVALDTKSQPTFGILIATRLSVPSCEMGIVLEYSGVLQDLVETRSSNGEMLSMPSQNSIAKIISREGEGWKLRFVCLANERDISAPVPVDAINPTADETH